MTISEEPLDMGQPLQNRQSLPADPAVRNFSYTIVNGKLYYREHSRMYLQDVTGKKEERIRGLVGITGTLRKLIDFQNEKQGVLRQEEYETTLKSHIADLNRVYDRFVKEYGYLNSKSNIAAFSRDSNTPLLRSIEKNGRRKRGYTTRLPYSIRQPYTKKICRPWYFPRGKR